MSGSEMVRAPSGRMDKEKGGGASTKERWSGFIAIFSRKHCVITKSTRGARDIRATDSQPHSKYSLIGKCGSHTSSKKLIFEADVDYYRDPQQVKM